MRALALLVILIGAPFAIMLAILMWVATLF